MTASDPRREMMQLSERAVARQLRLRLAVKSGRFRDYLRAEAKAARDRYQQFSDDAADAGELGG